MNYIVDAIILLCLVWGAYKGFRKGFIIQSFVILAIVLAIWGGFAFAGKFEPFIQTHLKVGDLACSIVSFVLVFLLVLLLVYVSGYVVSTVVNATVLGLFNRLSGATFGILANALILSVFILLFNRVNDKKQFIEPEMLKKTYLYEPVGKVAPAILPEKFFSML